MNSLDTSDIIEEEVSTSERLERVKKLVQKAARETVIEENEDFSFHLGMELFGQETSVIERTLQEKLVSLEKDLVDIVDDIKENDQPPESPKSPVDLEREAERLQHHIQFLNACSQARALLDESILLSSPALSNEDEDIAGAIQKVLDAQTQVTSLDHADLSTPQHATYRDLNAAVRRHKVELMGRLQKVWSESVQITPTALSVRNQNLGPIYKALALLPDEGILEMVLRKFTKSLMEVFTGLLERHRQGKVRSNWKIHESQDRISSSSLLAKKGTTRRLEWTRDDDDILEDSAEKTTTTSDWKGTFEFMQTILSFVSEHVLLERPELCHYVGRRFMGTPEALPDMFNLKALGIDPSRIGDDNGMILEPLMEILSMTTIPKFLEPEEMSTKLDAISEELDSFIEPFLQELVRCNMIGKERTRLDQFVASFEEKYVDNRRCQLINEARSLLIENDYHNTVEEGVDPPETDEDDGMSVFLFHKCSVSDTAAKLMVLCRKTMDEAVYQRPQPADSPLGLLPATLYRTAREILDLYRAIIPVNYDKEIKTVPRTAAIHHNDGVFLAQHCLTLGLEYRNRFPDVAEEDVQGKLLRKSCMFIDMVPLFRNMADKSLKDMLRVQATQVTELVEPRLNYLGKSLQSNEILAEWSEAESALEVGIYNVHQLHKAWKTVLAQDILDRCMAYLVDIVLTLFLNEISKATQVSVSATHFLRSLVQQGSDLAVGSHHSRTLGRWNATGQLIGMNLSEVSKNLGYGTFRSMTGAELAQLIQAVYPDSPQRRDILKALASHT